MSRKETQRSPDARLAQRLLRQARLSKEIVDAALARTATGEIRLEEALLEHGVGEAQLLRLLAELYQTQFITTEKLSKLSVAEKTLRLVPKALAERRLVVPLLLDASRQLLVVTPDPESLDLVKDLLIASQAREVKVLVGRPVAVRAAISKHYDGDQSAFTALAPTGFFPEEPQQITDSQGSFAQFHDQALIDVTEARTGKGKAVRAQRQAVIPRRPSTQRQRSHDQSGAHPLEPSRQVVPQTIEPPQQIEPPEAFDEIETLDDLEALDEIETLDDLEPLPEPGLALIQGGASPELNTAVSGSETGDHVSRVSSIPAPAEPDELEPLEPHLDSGLPLVASALQLTRALVSLHERGRRHLTDHSLITGQLAASLAAKLALVPEQQEYAELAGLIHDLGKSRLHHLTSYNVWSFEEHQRLARREFMRPESLLEMAGLPDPVVVAIRHLYERYDGGGFPSQLAAESIPLPSRILALTDSYADLTLNPANAFHRVLSPDEAIGALDALSGTVFDASLLGHLAALVATAGPAATATAES